MDQRGHASSVHPGRMSWLVCRLMEDGWILQSLAPGVALLLGTSSISPGGRAVAGSTGSVSGSFLRLATDKRMQGLLAKVNHSVIKSHSYLVWQGLAL